MAWTPEETAQIKAAVLALIRGERVVTISFAGPPARQVSYGVVDLATLRAMLTEAEGTSGTATYRLASTRKGLG